MVKPTVSSKLIEPVRRDLLLQLDTHKRAISSIVHGGTRDYDGLKSHIETYISLLTAADVLGGYTVIKED